MRTYSNYNYAVICYILNVLGVTECEDNTIVIKQ